MAHNSAATLGYLLDICDQFVVGMTGPMTLTLQDTYGVQRTVTVPVGTWDDYDRVFQPGVSVRPNGWLGDQGAPQLYYLNLNSYTTGPAEMRAAIQEASESGARGLVLDMRGYPGNVDHYEVAERLIQEPFLTPIFKVNDFNGVHDSSVSSFQYVRTPLNSPSFDGPIVVLTGPHAASAAENFVQMLVGAHRVTVVGQPSAGTNGNITGLQLPGGFGFTYTGMEVLNPDGGRFDGVGIKPDVYVP